MIAKGVFEEVAFYRTWVGTASNVIDRFLISSGPVVGVLLRGLSGQVAKDGRELTDMAGRVSKNQ
jgi:hypothetical protein